MPNGNNNRRFLNTISAPAKGDILRAIAAHYGTDPETILGEVTSPTSEHLLDYMTGRERLAASALMQRHGFR